MDLVREMIDEDKAKMEPVEDPIAIGQAPPSLMIAPYGHPSQHVPDQNPDSVKCRLKRKAENLNAYGDAILTNPNLWPQGTGYNDTKERFRIPTEWGRTEYFARDPLEVTVFHWNVTAPSGIDSDDKMFQKGDFLLTEDTKQVVEEIRAFFEKVAPIKLEWVALQDKMKVALKKANEDRFKRFPHLKEIVDHIEEEYRVDEQIAEERRHRVSDVRVKTRELMGRHLLNDD